MAQRGKSYKEYKSPLRKLLRFFEQSRDKWKEKCRKAKQEVKRLKKRVNFLEESRARWKKQAKEQEAEIDGLKREQADLAEEIETLKQKREEGLSARDELEAFSVIPAHHSYSVGHAALFINLVLSATSSLRASERVFEIVAAAFSLPLRGPSWTTGRLWLLRVGYYKLFRPKEKADDWAWIIDHSVQVGEEKCLVILGIRLSELPSPERCLEHKDVEPIALFPVKKSNGDVVYQQLEKTIEQTGVPREIVGDAGSDLRAGIGKFCQAHPETDYIYDIKHKTAAILRKELVEDAAWLEFKDLANKTRRQVQQTELAFLAPPKQKNKARYMNIEPLVSWGQKIIAFNDKAPAERGEKPDPVRLQKKVGWVNNFRTELTEWGQLVSDMILAECFIRKEGVYNGSCQKLREQLPTLEVETERTKRMRQQLFDFVIAQEAKAKADERLLGSSEIIESVFGKLKRVERQQAKSGFTGLLLSVAAMVSDTTTEIVQKALETVPTKTVLTWRREKLGKSVQSQRRKLLVSQVKTEQKRGQPTIPI